MCLKARLEKVDGDLRRVREAAERAELPAGKCGKAADELVGAAREVRRVIARVRGPENLDRIKPARSAYNAALTRVNGVCD